MPDAAYLGQILVNGVSVGCIYGLIGIGFCVIYNASGIVNFAQGAFVMLGGMVTFVLLNSLGLPIVLAGALAILAVAALGVAIERLVVRPLWDRNATMFVMILATLAAQIVIERATLILVGDQPKSIPVFTDLPPLRIAGISVGYQIIWIIGISLLLIGLLALFFQKTLVGRAMRACSINREAAALQGISVSRMLALSFALSAGLGAIAGILLTPTQFTAFNLGTPFAISGFIAAIVGGFRPAVRRVPWWHHTWDCAGARRVRARVRTKERSSALRAARVLVLQAIRNSRRGEVIGDRHEGTRAMNNDPVAFRRRLAAGEKLSGTFIKTPSGHATEIFGDLGYDFVVIDEEHAPFDRLAIDPGACVGARSAHCRFGACCLRIGVQSSFGA